ncbi:MAG: ribonuclease J [Myxococcales bacterium]|nr:ribonuclease J [Myxococcales bacterium]
MPKPDTLSIVPLGGLGEVGMNSLCIEYGDSRIVVDTGLTFPDDQLGAELIHPDFAYLGECPLAHQAVVLTHGHEDHVGALPFLLREHELPVHGTPYALAMAGERLAEHLPGLEPNLTPTRPGETFSVGSLRITPFRVSHSIPDCTGLVVDTPIGTLVHTADFRIDDAPPDGERLDQDAMAAVGECGVRVLLSDSTNVEREAIDGGERSVSACLTRHVEHARARVVVSMFASNVYRLQALVDAARATDRKLVLLGRSLQTHARVATCLGHLDGLDGVRIAPDDAGELPRNQVLIAATGSQGETRAALQRLANGNHPALRLEAGDEVLHSARIIPGKERTVYGLFDRLARMGVHVRHRLDDPGIHVSGHAPRADQRRMLELTRPQTFVPIHGSRHHLVRHGELARGMGIADVHIIENGTRLVLTETDSRVEDGIKAGRVHLQCGQPVDDIVLRDRAVLAGVGICVISVTVDGRGRRVTPVRAFTRGVFREDDEGELLDDIEEEVEEALAGLDEGANEEEIMDAACRPVRRLLKRTLGFRPPVHCIVTRTGS